MKDNVTKTDYGYDIVWADTDQYCGKILVFERLNSKTPLHFHKNKRKTWFVNVGKFTVQWIDAKDGKTYAQELPEGSTFEVLPLTPVILENLLENSAIAEVSNSNDPEDFYRLN